jgi:chromate reductase, NAD(P)H dehydrogenase (quinone)
MHFIGFSGSSRKASYNRALLRAVAELLPTGVTFEMIEIGGLPLYDQDAETEFPQIVKDIKGKIRAADGIVIATPEFNRSFSGVLKNAIDWTSRPYGDSAWSGKPVLVMGCSMGAIGTALAQYDLKKVLLYLNCRVLGQPEIYIGMAQEKFDASGSLTDEGTKTFLSDALKTFAEFASH